MDTDTEYDDGELGIPLFEDPADYEKLGEGFTACENGESCRWEIMNGEIVISRRQDGCYLYRVGVYRIEQKQQATEFCRGMISGVNGAF